MKKRKGTITILLILALLVIGVGYAVATTTLTINGTLGAKAADANFKVKFTAATTATGPTVTTAPSITPVATPSIVADSDDLVGAFTVENFTHVGDTVTFKYTIANESQDLKASVTATDKATFTNDGYFSVVSSFAASGERVPTTVINARSTADLYVTVTCTKTPIEDVSTQTTTGIVTAVATAVEASGT